MNWGEACKMCGRYYMNACTEKLLEAVEGGKPEFRKTGDIHPTEQAPVLSVRGGHVRVSLQIWGFPGVSGKGVIFNARAETVLSKPMFQRGMRFGRVAVPAAGFYEWNRRKEKSTFTGAGGKTLFFAGLSGRFEDGDHFVILTTRANETMEPVHDRMPLILDAEEMRRWLLDGEEAGELLKKVPGPLNRKSEYEQLTLFDL